jgi:hypothetical protein
MPDGQSASLAQVHAPQPGSTCPTLMQFGPFPLPAQSAEVRHDTQVWDVGPHVLAFVSVQSPSVVHPTQVWLGRSHTFGAQSALEEHGGGGQPGSAQVLKSPLPLEPLEPLELDPLSMPVASARKPAPPSPLPEASSPTSPTRCAVPPHWPSALAAATSSAAIAERPVVIGDPPTHRHAAIVPRAWIGESYRPGDIAPRRRDRP